MSLPPIDFAAISATARGALASYGTPVEFREGGTGTARTIHAVIYRDGQTLQQFIADADVEDAIAILNPDDFRDPNRMPQKFDRLTLSIEGFQRIYTIDSVAPIIAASTLPLIQVRLKVV